MRSAFSAFGRLLTDSQTADLKAEAKWLAGCLGPARDWDVFLAGTLTEVERHHAADPALSAVRQQAERARQAAYAQARNALLSQRTTRFVLTLGRWYEAHEWRTDSPADRLHRPLATFAADTLNRQYRKVRKGGRGLTHLPDEARHQLRIGIKKLRYTAEFFALLFDSEAARTFIAEAVKLQDALGDLNDRATLRIRLDRLQADAPGDVQLARGIGTVVGDAGADPAAAGEKALRDAWRRFRRVPAFWPSAQD